MSIAVGVDSSVLVKWFKKGENHEQEALKLRDDILAGVVNPVMSEWAYLEIVRALVRCNTPKPRFSKPMRHLRKWLN